MTVEEIKFTAEHLKKGIDPDVIDEIVRLAIKEYLTYNTDIHDELLEVHNYVAYPEDRLDEKQKPKSKNCSFCEAMFYRDYEDELWNIKD